jgi:hypothetical protein
LRKNEEEEYMGNKSKQEYYKDMAERYKKTIKRSEKSYLIFEISVMTGHHRKHVIRKINQLIKGFVKKNRPGRKPYYSDIEKFHVKKLWLKMKQMCSSRIKAALPFWVDFYSAPGFTDEVKSKVLQMSSATIDRHLFKSRSQYGRQFRTGTRRNWVTTVIPIKPMDQKIAVPGHMEADTVAHCGGSMSGTFVWSLTMTEVLLGWTFNKATFGNKAKETIKAIRKIEDELPFSLEGFNVDNGTEFINGTLVYYSQRLEDGTKRELPLKITRSRSYRKNDNCNVEQKNFTHVRELFGYERIDNEELVPLMDAVYLYDNILQNFFMPQVRMIEKMRIGSKYKRKFDKPQTPYHRTLNCDQIPQEVKDKLKTIYEKLNPLQLQQQVEHKLKSFLDLKKELEEPKKIA